MLPTTLSAMVSSTLKLRSVSRPMLRTLTVAFMGLPTVPVRSGLRPLAMRLWAFTSRSSTLSKLTREKVSSLHSPKNFSTTKSLAAKGFMSTVSSIQRRSPVSVL